MIEYQLDGDGGVNLEPNHKGQIATGARACLPSLEVGIFAVWKSNTVRCVFVFLGLCVSVNTDGSRGGTAVLQQTAKGLITE